MPLVAYAALSEILGKPIDRVGINEEVQIEEHLVAAEKTGFV